MAVSKGFPILQLRFWYAKTMILNFLTLRFGDRTKIIRLPLFCLGLM